MIRWIGIALLLFATGVSSAHSQTSVDDLHAAYEACQKYLWLGPDKPPSGYAQGYEKCVDIAKAWDASVAGTHARKLQDVQEREKAVLERERKAIIDKAHSGLPK